MKVYKKGDIVKTTKGLGEIVERREISFQSSSYLVKLDTPSDNLSYVQMDESHIKGLWKEPIEKLKEKGFKVVVRTKYNLLLCRENELRDDVLNFLIPFNEGAEYYELIIKGIYIQPELNLIYQLLEKLNKER